MAVKNTERDNRCGIAVNDGKIQKSADLSIGGYSILSRRG